MSSKELKINPVFRPVFSDKLDDKRYYQVYGGRGSGKSYTVAIAMVLKTYSKHDHRILYLRQTQASIEDSSIADIRKAIEDLGLGEDFRERNGRVTNKTNGAFISFKGMRSSGSSTAKLKSLSAFTTIVFEEAEEIESYEEFRKADQSIRIKGKPLKIILVYNPTSSVESWIHEKWFDSGFPITKRMNRDTEYMHSTYLDNIDNLGQSTIDDYERTKEDDPIEYKNVILAEWTLEVVGRIYSGWEFVDYFEERGDVWYGLDFGYGGTDRTACVEVNYVNDKYYVREMFSMPSQKTIDATVLMMRQCGVPNDSRIFADSAMPLLIEEIRRKGFLGIVPATKGNKEEAIKKVQNKLIALVGGEKNKHLYKSYMTFRREPSGKLPHEPDELAALRYAILSKTPIRNRRRGRKPTLPKHTGYV